MNNLKMSCWRNLVQILFALFLLVTGYRFYLFVRFYETAGVATPPPRPPAVEGFLPISALMTLKNLLVDGVWDNIHPAGLVILMAILITAFLFRKSFCSWLCPVGALSEVLGQLGAKLKIRIENPHWLDLGLMSLKYLLLAFFVKTIFWDMNGVAVAAFLQSPYNAIADVKMLKFFTELSPLAWKILISLGLISVIFRNFWCRYLCPYGALLGLISYLSPLQVVRDKKLCSNCGACAKSCPNRIKVDHIQKAVSPECTSCHKCLDACSTDGALNLKWQPFQRQVPNWFYPFLFLVIFFGIIMTAKLGGYWHTSLTNADYRQLIPNAAFFRH